ncbi:hypothetical protein BGZ94_005812 [Podila epigama]|nr:hypothetical protein BGZ94_005812 [Podila epigama]
MSSVTLTWEQNDNVNSKNHSGATELHLAASRNDIALVKALLAHPKIDVNIKDVESGWTALHRLEVGPCPGDALYTWGSNSNLSLGHNDGDDRKMPELVKFPYSTRTFTFQQAKLARPTISQISMSKFHTAVATLEQGSSAKVWGFGSSGRLGSDKKMQLRPATVPGISGTVVAIALGRDHTVLVTARGEVFTMGNNKYGQLGYAIDNPANGQDPIQLQPKRIIAPIGKLSIVGAAASRWHTVVHTSTELFTFGFNYGQLGYERKGDCQVIPRKVASMPSGSILQVAASDSATACLMSSHDVYVFHKYAYSKITYPPCPHMESIFPDSTVHARNGNSTRKIFCSENKFTALTSSGDIFFWSYPEVDSNITLGTLPATHGTQYTSIPPPPKVRRVWTNAGGQSQAIDVALGHNGSLILLTKVGHVFLGTNKGNADGRNVKWQRVPHLDRIVQVSANPSGAWAALRSESTLTAVPIRKGRLGVDFEQSLSQYHLYQMNDKGDQEVEADSESDSDEDDGEKEEKKAERDYWRIGTQGWMSLEESWDFDVVPLLDRTVKQSCVQEDSVAGSHLFDVEIQAGKRCLGAHRIILASRSMALRRAFVDSPRSRTVVGMLAVVEPMPNCTRGILYTIHLKVEFQTAVLLLQFLYSDRMDPYWDALDLPKSHKAHALKVRQELYHLAMELGLPTLQAALQYSFTHACNPSLPRDLGQLLEDGPAFKSMYDVRLLLKDEQFVDAHQVILGHRSPFFYAMTVRTNEWIRDRSPRKVLPGASDVNLAHDSDILKVNMKHMDIETVKLVLKYMYTDCGPELFDETEREDIMDLTQVVLDVLQIADEWLIDRLKDICEHVLGMQVRAKTVVNFLEIALALGAESLKTTCVDYLCHNIESALDQQWLKGVDDDILSMVEDALKQKQLAESSFVRSGGYLPDEEAVEAARKRVLLEGPRDYIERGYYYRHDFTMDADYRQRRKLLAAKGISRGSTSTAGPQSAGPPAPLTSQETPVVQTQIASQPRSNASPTTSTSLNTHSISRSDSTPLVEASSSEWPKLSSTPSSEPRDIPTLTRRKSNWGQVTLPENSEPPSQELGGENHERPLTSTSKPSLREILEQEQQQQQHQQPSSQHDHHAGMNKSSGASPVVPKASKLSQKDRRKLLQQQQQAASEQPQSPAPVVSVWNKPSPVDSSPNLVRRNSYGLATTDNAAAGLLSFAGGNPGLLEMSELAHFRSQASDAPKTAFATSKPVKETMRPQGTERSTFEAPWRLDAIPEPLRAITRHQSQMYQKLESTTSTSTSSSMAQTRQGSFSGSSLDRADGPLVSSTNGNAGPLAMKTTNNEALVTAPMSLSSFAFIQNQQLRDRNMLLKARHHKKSLYQIQVEERALSEIRMMYLDHAKASSSEGAGEWFTCDISLRP